MEPGEPIPAKRSTGLRLAIILAVATFFAISIYFRLLNVNSDYYYVWQWKWSPSKFVYPILIPLAIPLFIGQLIYQRRPKLLGIALACVMISAFAMMIGAALSQNDPPGFSRIIDVVQSRWSTGYFDSAATIVRRQFPVHELLRRYPTLLDHFNLHPRQKPPGLLLFEIAVIHLFGDGSAGAIISGLLTGLIASFSVVTAYCFISVHTENRDAAFFGASFFALCPSLILFFPDFDPTFPNFTAGLAVLWALSLKKDHWPYAAIFGLLYAFALLFTHLVGVLPIFFLGYTIVRARNATNFHWARAFAYLGVSLVFFAAFYLILWHLTGFDPITTLRECARQNAILWDKLINVFHYPVHSLPWTFFTDLYDFALGSGWISFVLVAFYFRSAIKTGLTPPVQVAVASVLQFLVIAAIGLLQTECARIWIFMYPMLMLPIGLELASWPAKQRLAVYAALLVIMITMCQSIEFLTAAR